jgi:hypothetical protein
MSDSRREQLVYAFRRILRQLIKIVIRAGMRYDEFALMVRGVFVESAIRDGIGAPGQLTRARVSLSTGVPRRDVDRFVDDKSLLAVPEGTIAQALVAVMHLWNTDATYLGPYGLPLEIDFDTTKGRCFKELAIRAGGSDIDAMFLLEELIRSGVVTGSGSHYKILSRVYVIPEPMSPVNLENFGNVLTRLAQTLEINMNEKNEFKRLERSVYADNGLTVEELGLFEKYIRERVQVLIADIDDWLVRLDKPDESQPEVQRYPAGLNFFQYVDDQIDDKDLKELLGE